jgi:hypothetical protein
MGVGEAIVQIEIFQLVERQPLGLAGPAPVRVDEQGWSLSGTARPAR